MGCQNEAEGALAELREQHQDDVDHLKELQTHYEERETAYEVRRLRLALGAYG